MEKLVDMSLGIKPVAWAILSLMRNIDCDAITDEKYPLISTSAFYNGREKGICIYIHRKSFRRCVAFSENRNRDDIVIYAWTEKGSINPPTVDNLTDEAWHNACYLKYDQLNMAVNKIIELLKQD